MEEPQNSVPEPRKSNARFLLELVEIVLIAFVLSWALRTFVVEARLIPSGSMLPTIQLQDRIIVDKFYFKYFDHIREGDIVVFRPPPLAHSSEDFIKRVIGLPGDTVQIKNNLTYVDSKALQEPYLKDKTQSNYGPVVVPPGDLFVMGDNRNNSDDSRYWGFLPLKNVTGRALFRYWPLSHFGPLAK